jgi:GAF domain-containing protein
MSLVIDPHALATSLSRLEERLEGAVLEDSLRQVVHACTKLFDIDGSGLMLADEQSVLRYAVATDPPAQALEDLQIETGEGPCVDTYVHNRMVFTSNVVDPDSWPKLAPLIEGQGIGAVLGVPIRLADTPVGSLDVYRHQVHVWRPDEKQALLRYGEVAETMLAAALQAEQAGQLASQLNYALEYRVPIERGIGYLMARDNLSSTEAFNRLRAAARSSRRKIGDVAEQLLLQHRLPGE